MRVSPNIGTETVRTPGLTLWNVKEGRFGGTQILCDRLEEGLGSSCEVRAQWSIGSPTIGRTILK